MAYKFVVKQTYLGQQVINTFCYEDDGNPNNSDANDIAQAIVNLWSANLVSSLHTSWSMDEIVWYDTNAPAGAPPSIASVTGLPLVGTNASKPAPTQLAMVVTLTAENGPPWRGRNYLAGLTSDTISTSGLWTNGIIADVKTVYDALLSISVGGLRVLGRVIISEKSQNIPAGTQALIGTNTPQAIPASVRSRRIGVGA